MSGDRVLVVTDSTSSLSPRPGIDVVPLVVETGAGTVRDGEGFGPVEAVAALRGGEHLRTSGPAPGDFADAYARAADAGARAVVSVHLSGELSGTVHAAALAASRAPIPVRVVDSRTTAMGLGLAVLAAVEAAARGAGPDEVAHRATRVADSSTVSFLVDSLDHLRRGGRLGAGAAALGTLLGVRPILTTTGGRLEVSARVRPRSAAVDRLVDDAVGVLAACARPAWAVQALGADDAAARLVDRLTTETGVEGGVHPVSAALAAHVGPRVLAIAVADLGEGDPAARRS